MPRTAIPAGRNRESLLREEFDYFPKWEVTVAIVPTNISVPSFLRRVAKSRQSVLLLDYDGTLAPFSPDRYRALPYPGVMEVLTDIMETGRTRVAFVTGRRAHELLPLLELSPPPEIWGTHGRERLNSDGSYERQPIDEMTLDALSQADQWVDSIELHHLVEHKPASMAVHWRGLSDVEVHEIRNKVLLGWLPIADRACLTIEHFDGGVELRPADCSKADAVRAILAEVPVDAPVAYLGDDEADENVFDALQDRGLRVLVRPNWRETSADVWLRPPIQLLQFLSDWLSVISSANTGQARQAVSPIIGKSA
jgi:trehalose 6-phosphate phosphatase